MDSVFLSSSEIVWVSLNIGHMGFVPCWGPRTIICSFNSYLLRAALSQALPGARETRQGPCMSFAALPGVGSGLGMQWWEGILAEASLAFSSVSLYSEVV